MNKTFQQRWNGISCLCCISIGETSNDLDPNCNRSKAKRKMDCKFYHLCSAHNFSNNFLFWNYMKNIIVTSSHKPQNWKATRVSKSALVKEKFVITLYCTIADTSFPNFFPFHILLPKTGICAHQNILIFLIDYKCMKHVHDCHYN